LSRPDPKSPHQIAVSGELLVDATKLRWFWGSGLDSSSSLERGRGLGDLTAR
ncbi:hypothetical protein P7K49_025309, partial [Saguinus oedipus]